jgi:hypothetical protein
LYRRLYNVGLAERAENLVPIDTQLDRKIRVAAVLKKMPMVKSGLLSLASSYDCPIAFTGTIITADR